LGTVVQVSAESAADVPDEALRPALELAVGVAATGAKLRPPLPFPTELRRFLRFHKLPPAALAQVRGAIEGDADFRKRLGSVATAELVDDVGVLWLSRPDGWVQAIAELLPTKVVDQGPALRREERRRLAAEEAAARGRAELLGAMAELERERAAKTALIVDRDRLTVELDEVRSRLREAQRAEHAMAQTLAKVESELHEARLAMLEAEPAAPPPPAVDVETLRRLLDGAVSASTDSVRLLTAALDELAEVEATATGPADRVQRGRVWRKAVRLRGGVLAGTVEAAEFLLRVKGARILIDGYNVAKLGWPSLDLDHQREQCIIASENMAKRWNMAMTIVYDGASVEGAHSPARRKVRITYSPAGVSADDVLRAEVASLDAAKPVVVVTNDRAILTDVTAAGANTVSSDHFLVLLRR
ncbi:MAG: NYN domain-containing protein, partial [Ilumatobacteraceae bacterium]